MRTALTEDEINFAINFKSDEASYADALAKMKAFFETQKELQIHVLNSAKDLENASAEDVKKNAVRKGQLEQELVIRKNIMDLSIKTTIATTPIGAKGGLKEDEIAKIQAGLGGANALEVGRVKGSLAATRVYRADAEEIEKANVAATQFALTEQREHEDRDAFEKREIAALNERIRLEGELAAKKNLADDTLMAKENAIQEKENARMLREASARELAGLKSQNAEGYADEKARNKANILSIHDEVYALNQKDKAYAKLRQSIMGVSFSGFIMSMAFGKIAKENKTATAILQWYTTATSTYGVVVGMVTAYLEMNNAAKLRAARVSEINAHRQVTEAAAYTTNAYASGAMTAITSPWMVPAVMGMLALTGVGLALYFGKQGKKVGGVVDQDGAQMLHKGEFVQTENERIASMFGGQGAGGSGMHFHGPVMIYPADMSQREIARELSRQKYSGA